MMLESAPLEAPDDSEENIQPAPSGRIPAEPTPQRPQQRTAQDQRAHNRHCGGTAITRLPDARRPVGQVQGTGSKPTTDSQITNAKTTARKKPMPIQITGDHPSRPGVRRRPYHK